MRKILTVFGNRPQFIKAGVVSSAIDRFGGGDLREVTVHTGQHYDAALSDDIFRDLGMRKPDHHLGLGSGPLLDSIGKMLPLLRELVEAERPDAILAYGDTNSTAAAAMTAGHCDLPFIHIEAGERNFRRRQAPEEINRIIADHLCSLALVSTRKAERYLALEGFHPDRVGFVGDTMLDLFMKAAGELEAKRKVDLGDFNVKSKEFYLATIHRAENTDDPDRLVRLMTALDSLDLPVVLPAHPRTKAVLQRIGWRPGGSLRLFDPVGYFDVLYLAHNARATITDSGGLSKESFFAGVPVIVPLPNSGWREIVEQGWAKVIPDRFDTFPEALAEFETLGERSLEAFGDGRSGEKIVEALKDYHYDVSRTPWHVAGPFDAVAPADSTRPWRIDTVAAVSEPTVLLIRALPDGEAGELAALVGRNQALEPVLCVGDQTLNPASPDFTALVEASAGRARVMCEPDRVAALTAFLDALGLKVAAVEGREGAGRRWTELDASILAGGARYIEAARIAPFGMGRLEALERETARAHRKVADSRLFGD
ncbi:MAG: UDP-N-acetyl glucosamine 2-epimerase [Oceanicaulis sp.]